MKSLSWQKWSLIMAPKVHRQEHAAIRAEVRNAGKRKRQAKSGSGAGSMLAGGKKNGEKRRLQQTSLMLMLFALAELNAGWDVWGGLGGMVGRWVGWLEGLDGMVRGWWGDGWDGWIMGSR